jgi:hypothetical protein
MAAGVYASAVGVFSMSPPMGQAVADRAASLGYSVVLWTAASDVSSENLADVDVLFLLSGSAMWLGDESSVIQSYVASGGGLIVEQPNFEGPVDILPPELAVSVYNRAYTDLNVQLTPAGQLHPMTAGLSAADIPGNMDVVFSADISPAYTVLAAGASDPALVALAVASYGSGRVSLETGNVHPLSLSPGSDEFLQRLIDWTAAGGGGEAILGVQIDIKPGSVENSINLKSKGVVPVALLTADDFDALAADPVTVRFAGADALRWSRCDADGDGDVDLLLHFSTQMLDLDSHSTEAVMTGTTFSGQEFEGSDAVRIVPKK